MCGPCVQWYRPSSLDQLLVLRHKFPHHTDTNKPHYRIVAGNSEIGIQIILSEPLLSVTIIMIL